MQRPSGNGRKYGPVGCTRYPWSLELQVAQDRVRHQAHHVAERGDLELGRLRPRRHRVGRAAGLVPGLQDHGSRAGLRQVRRGDQPVVAAADHDRVVLVREWRCGVTLPLNGRSAQGRASAGAARSNGPAGGPEPPDRSFRRCPVAATTPVDARLAAGPRGRSRRIGSSSTAATNAETPADPVHALGSRAARAPGPANTYASAIPSDRSASKPAITRLRTASGERRIMIPCSATIEMPSLMPMMQQRRPARPRTSARTRSPGRPRPIPAAPSTSQTGSVRWRELATEQAAHHRSQPPARDQQAETRRARVEVLGERRVRDHPHPRPEQEHGPRDHHHAERPIVPDEPQPGADTLVLVPLRVRVLPRVLALDGRASAGPRPRTSPR